VEVDERAPLSFAEHLDRAMDPARDREETVPRLDALGASSFPRREEGGLLFPGFLF
jgi:hypothetical protein